MTVPFSRPDIGQDEIDAVVECMRSGWLTTGPRCQAFERAFAEFVGGNIEAIAVASGTAGLEIALSALGIGAGDEVITTPYSFFATAGAIVRLGATPVFADIDRRTYNIDPARIESKVTSRTRAIPGLGLGLHISRRLAEQYGGRLWLDDSTDTGSVFALALPLAS